MVDYHIPEFGGMSVPAQDPGANWTMLDVLGSRLSTEVCNGVRWPGFNKNMFLCRHGFPIPVFRLRGKEAWSEIKAEHDVYIYGQGCTS